MKVIRPLWILVFAALLSVGRVGAQKPVETAAVAQVRADGPGGVLLFERGPNRRLLFTLRDAPAGGPPLSYRLEITDFSDVVRHRAEGAAPEGPRDRPLALAFDTSRWPLGPYEGRLTLYGGANPAAGKTLHAFTFRLGVISGTKIDKARPGEFLFGLDPANTHIFPTQNAEAFVYYDKMGVDLLRDVHEQSDGRDMEGVGRALARLKPHGVQAAIVYDVPKQGDDAERRKAVERAATYLTELARRYAGRGPGRLHFFELGNEPDLRGFYGGPMANYVADMHTLYDAIKRGARAQGLRDADTFVMNGGLSFAGEEGKTRSREFFQRVDPKRLDAFAYHGHGPGMEAERGAHERAVRTAREFGKAVLPFVETESGYSGNSRAGVQEQARTVVEKSVFAQSVGMPTLLYFRLFMESAGTDEGGYGLTERRLEPRPSVLSYRAMAERLRRHRFVKALPFAREADADGAQAFLFAEYDDGGKPTGRKTLVAFSELPARHDLSVRLDRPSAPARAAQTYDLYGNAIPTEARSNVASLSVGIDPLYVTWVSAGDAAQVRVAPPLLSARAAEPLLAGANNMVPLVLRNPGDKPLRARLEVRSYARLAIRATPAARSVILPAGKSLALPLAVALGEADQPLRLPRWWKVFVDADTAKLDAALLSRMPDALPGAGGGADVTGAYAAAENNRLSIARLAPYREKRPAVAYAYLDSPRAMKLPVAASADWWMAWYVNGEKVYDTLATGNRHGSLADHTFDLPLKKGRNVIAVLVLSGSQGWSLDLGGPKERALAQAAGAADPDRLDLTLREGGKVIARRTVPLSLSEPVPPLGAIGDATDPRAWLDLEPLAVLDEQAVVNRFVKEPDQSRWYKGRNDLSALVWVRRGDDGAVHLVALVRDEVPRAATGGGAENGDGLSAVFLPEGGKPLVVRCPAAENRRAVVTVGGVPVNTAVRRVADKDGTPRTVYHLTLPPSVLRNTPFRLSVSVADDDAGYVKQTLHLGSPDKPQQGVRLRVPPPPPAGQRQGATWRGGLPGWHAIPPASARQPLARH